MCNKLILIIINVKYLHGKCKLLNLAKILFISGHIASKTFEILFWLCYFQRYKQVPSIIVLVVCLLCAAVGGIYVDSAENIFFVVMLCVSV